MNRFINDWREVTRWNADFDEGPAHLRAAAKLGLDAPGDDDELAPAPIMRKVVSIDPFEVAEEAGRYLPSNEAADPVEEVGLYLPLAGPAHDVEADTHFLDYNPRLHDPALDEFFFEARFGESHGHGPYGLETRRIELTDDGSDVFFVSPASDPDEDSTEVFISLPEGETASVVQLGDATEDFGFGSFSREDVTFGGGENPCWMLTLLSSSDGHNNDAWFGHPEPGIDPWG